MNSIKELHQITKDIDILFVEDDEELRNQMQNMFSNLFNLVDTGDNGESGLQKYKNRLEKMNKSYDLVITDINMPKMNGVEMINRIYEINPLQPVIVVSAHNESEQLMDLLHVGIKNFLIKPVNHKELINTLYNTTKAIMNEKLVEKHYKEIEKLNQKLFIQREELKKSNEEMHEKNIALEKSMRIIEGMRHKDQLNRKIAIPFRSLKINNTQEDVIDKSPSLLKNIEQLINDIAVEYPYKKIDEKSLIQLSKAINEYASSIPDEENYETLKVRLKQLGTAIADKPNCNSKEDLERIFSMLESFFFIYIKWENEWKNIDIDKFKIFSSSIESEILVLIDVWKCKV